MVNALKLKCIKDNWIILNDVQEAGPNTIKMHKCVRKCRTGQKM